MSTEMASPEEDDFSGGSLFEGMVLFSPSDLSLPPQSLKGDSSPPGPPPLSSTPRDPPPRSAPSPPPPSTSEPQSQSQLQPLDEDLFSDLTLLSPSQTLELDPLPANSQSPSRQTSRKKKRAVRIGYARDALPLEDHSPVPSPLEPQTASVPITPPQRSIPDPQLPSESAAEIQPKGDILSEVIEDRASEAAATGGQEEEATKEVAPDRAPEAATTGGQEEVATKEVVPDGDSEAASTGGQEEEATNEAAPDSMEDKLELVRARISSKLGKIQEEAELLSLQRKELGRRRRKALENVHLASEKYKELERELEEACEAEDFERAERLSESLAEKEKEKDKLLTELRDAELECDAVDLKMQEVLEMQIAAEEEGAALLEQFAKDAADYADSVLRTAEEISSKDLQEWESSIELLEMNRIEMEIESQLVSEARSGLENSIEHLVEDDRKEVELLRIKQGILSRELDELLALVKLKEAEIAENDSQIHNVEKKISEAVSEFHGTRANIDMKHDSMQWSLSKLEYEHEALSIKKKEIDEFMLQAQKKGSKLRELASVTLDEVETSQELVGLRKSLASSILKSREDKVRFAKTEEIILEEVQMLRQHISAARATLQELSSSRVSIQQEITLNHQRIGFIDKRGPELEAEKKIAAAARNFKEAGRIAAEAKALNAEKENLEAKIEKDVSELKKLEEDIKDTVDKIQESESLILLKEKEVAMACCQRLRLVAASARAERSAALEMGDIEEGETLLQESEAAESKATELQETYDLKLEEHAETWEQSVSVAFVTKLSGQQLAEISSSFNLSASVESQT